MTSGEKPRLIVVAGPNGSGKTSITQQLLMHEWMDGLTATENFIDFHGLSFKNLGRSQEPTASWAESNACREGVRPGGTCGRLISVKFPTRGEFEWRKPSRTLGQPR